MGPVLVIGFLVLGMLLVVVALVAAWRLYRPVVEEVAWNGFPPAELERQSNLAATLRDGGFAFAGFQRETRGGGEPVWQSLFRFGEGAVWAVVEALPDESPRIVLHTFFGDGRTLTTSSGSFSEYNITAEWELKEGTWGEFGEQAHCHLESALSSVSKPVALETADDFRERYEATIGKEIDELRKLGVVAEHPAREGAFKWATWMAPLKAPGLLLSASGYDWLFKRSKPAGSRDGVVVEPGDDGEKIDLLTLYGQSRQRETTLSSRGWTKRGAVFCGTIIALLLVFLVLDELAISTALIIVAVIIVHELGHVLAMRFSGARDDRVMVLPFLAQWAGERRGRLSARQQFFVLLMGPLPGLLAGWGLLVIVAYHPGLPGFLKQLAFWLALYNNLNLLPLLPFDGGRVANLLVFDRFPGLRLAYFVATEMLTIGVLLVMQFAVDWPAWLLLLLPASTMLALPDMIRSVRPGRSAKKALSSGTDETEALRKAVQIVEEEKSLARLKTGKQIEFVDKVLGWGCTKRLGGAGTVVAMLVFLAALAAPLWVMIGLTLGEAYQVRVEQGLIEARLVALEAEVTRPAVVVTRRTRSELKLLSENFQEALAHMYTGDVEIDSEVFDFDARGIYDPDEALRIVRGLQWDQVAAWIEEGDSQSRQETAKVLVQTLMGDAREQSISGNHRRAMDDLSKAYWAVSMCKPTASLASWIDWLYLEREVLGRLEEALSAGHLHAQYGKWFASALRSRSEVDGKKMAILLLRDLGGAPGPAAPATGGNTAIKETGEVAAGNNEASKIGSYLAGKGLALRRSQPDLEYRRRQKGTGPPPGFGNLLSFTRILRGLPTREEFASGLTVAENWATGRVIDLDLAYELENVEQRKIWEARILCMERLIHYRRLGVVAFETELSGLAPERGSRHLVSTRPAVRLGSLVGGGAENYAVVSEALDGTRLHWRLSPSFRPKKIALPAPTPEPAAPVSLPVLAKTLQPADTTPSGQTPAESQMEVTTEPVKSEVPEEEGGTEGLDEFNLLDEFQRLRTGPGWDGSPALDESPVPVEPPAPVSPAE